MITGRTRIIAHIGVPTENFVAPMIYNPWFEANGIDTVVVPVGCEAADFAGFLRHLFRLRNVAGALITMPHKIAAAGLVETASEAVAVCGACNAVRRDAEGRLVGDMFDGEGFVRGLARKGRAIAGSSALVVGSGGVGSAIAAALARNGVSRLDLFDTDAAASDKLAAALSARYPGIRIATGSNDPAGRDIVVNATPLGMRDADPLPMDAGRIDGGAFVGEVVMRDGDTPLLAAARARGCSVQVGTDMLFEQIPAYLEFFGYPAATPDELRAAARIPG